MAKKWVYLFTEVEEAEKYVNGSWDAVRGLLGGKGANLFEMTRIKLPVPPGFTVTTEACNAYLAAGEKFPEGMWDQELAALKAIEQITGKSFGDAKNPLLVSCRSGAKYSMPGMMDTVLNIGLTDATVEGLAALTAESPLRLGRLPPPDRGLRQGRAGHPRHRVRACARTRMKEKAGAKLDADLTTENLKALTGEYKAIVKKHKGFDFPQNPIEQLRLATEAVFKSWNGKRAFDYRNHEGIPHNLGTAVNIVTMVFGNMGNTSGTGVAFTRNPSTGEKARLRRVPDQRPGRGRGRRHPHPAKGGGDGRRAARGVRAVHGHLRDPGEALPRHAGRRVHHRARQAVDAADPQRQAHRGGGHQDRGGHGERRADHQAGSRDARDAPTTSTRCCTRSSTRRPRRPRRRKASCWPRASTRPRARPSAGRTSTPTWPRRRPRKGRSSWSARSPSRMTCTA